MQHILLITVVVIACVSTIVVAQSPLAVLFGQINPTTVPTPQNDAAFAAAAEYFKAPELSATAVQDQQAKQIQQPAEPRGASVTTEQESATATTAQPLEDKDEAAFAAAAEYFKAPELSASAVQEQQAKQKEQPAELKGTSQQKSAGTTTAQPLETQRDEAAFAAAAEYFKAPEPAKKREQPEEQPQSTQFPATVATPRESQNTAPTEVRRKAAEQWVAYKKHLHKALDHCQARHNMSVAISDKLMNIEQPHVNSEMECYVQCLLEKLGYMQNGSIDFDGIRDTVGLVITLKRLDRVLNMCQDVRGVNSCDTAYKFFKCYRLATLEIRRQEDEKNRNYVWMVVN